MRLFLTLTTGPLCHWGLFAIRARDLPPAGGMEPPSAREIKMFLLFSRVGSGEPTGMWHQGAAPCPSAGAQEGEEKESKKEEGGKERREGAADLVPEREERGQSPPDSSERSGPGAAPRDPLRAGRCPLCAPGQQGFQLESGLLQRRHLPIRCPHNTSPAHSRLSLIPVRFPHPGPGNYFLFFSF